MSLREKALAMNTLSDVMKGRDKGELDVIIGQPLTVTDFEIIVLKNEKTKLDQDVIVFIVKEDDANFFFGGEVVTGKFKNFDEKDIKEIKTEGLPIVLGKKKSKTKGHNDYTTIVFFPEENDIANANK